MEVSMIVPNKAARLRFKRTLSRAGYHVSEFATLESALDEMLEAPPSMVLCALELPDGNGFELISRLRNHYDADKLPIVLVGKFASEDDLLRGYAAGADDVLSFTAPPGAILARCELLAKRTKRSRRGGVPVTGPFGGLDGLPRKLAARYDVRRTLGRGGCAVVLEAYERSGGERVAIKLFDVSSVAMRDAQLRFLRESMVMGQLANPHIIRLIDVGSEGDQLYLVIEHLEGLTVREKTLRHAPATPAQGAQMLLGLLSALATLEEHNIVHRDLSPGNVMLRGGAWDQPVLLDFGLAKQPFDTGVTSPDLLLGTPGYIAPEYLYGNDIDHRYDLYGLGMLTRFALTQRDPFDDYTERSRLNAAATQEVDFPATIPMCLRDLLYGLTFNDRDRRPSSAAALLAKASGPGSELLELAGLASAPR